MEGTPEWAAREGEKELEQRKKAGAHEWALQPNPRDDAREFSVVTQYPP